MRATYAHHTVRAATPDDGMVYDGATATVTNISESNAAEHAALYADRVQSTCNLFLYIIGIRRRTLPSHYVCWSGRVNYICLMHTVQCTHSEREASIGMSAPRYR